MTLPLPGNPVDDYNIQQKFDAIALAWPDTIGALHLVGGAGEPAFQTTWVNEVGQTAASFYKDRGRVYLNGLVKGGGLSTVVFILPVGYRPPSSVTFAISTGIGGAGPNVGGLAYVDGAGNVVFFAGTANGVGLAAINFRAA